MLQSEKIDDVKWGLENLFEYEQANFYGEESKIIEPGLFEQQVSNTLEQITDNQWINLENPSDQKDDQLVRGLNISGKR